MNMLSTAAMRKLWRILEPRRRTQLVLLPILMVFGGVLEALSIGTVPLFIGLLTDPRRALDLPVVGPWLAPLASWTPEDILLIGGTAIGGFFLFRGAVLVGLQYVTARFTAVSSSEIAARLFRLYMNASYTFHLGRNSSELTRNVHIETQRCGNQIIFPLLQIILNSVLVVAICSTLVVADPMLAIIVSLAGAAISFGLLRSMRGAAARHGQQLTVQNGLLLKAAQEGFGAYKDLWLRGTITYVVDRVRRVLLRRARALFVQQFLGQAVKPVIETVGMLGLLLLPMILVLRGAPLVETVPLMTLLAVVLARLLPTVNQLTQQLVKLRSNAYSLDVLHGEIVALERDGPHPPRLAQERAGSVEFEKAIVLDRVSFEYAGTGRKAVSGLSLAIPKGSSVAFVGSTGAGKTTIVDLIIGVLAPTGGSVLVDGRNIATELPGWTRQIGYIPQSIYLLDDSIRRNVALAIPDKDIDDAAVMRALAVAQLDDVVNKLPHGLDTLVGERGTRLSGGQRQRLGIARALFHDPSVLVLDEATSAVDNVTERKLMTALDAARAGRTFIMVAHRLSTVRGCDVIYFMKDGRLAGEGDFDSLRRDNHEFNELAV